MKILLTFCIVAVAENNPWRLALEQVGTKVLRFHLQHAHLIAFPFRGTGVCEWFSQYESDFPLEIFHLANYSTIAVLSGIPLFSCADVQSLHDETQCSCGGNLLRPHD